MIRGVANDWRQLESLLDQEGTPRPAAAGWTLRGTETARPSPRSARMARTARVGGLVALAGAFGLVAAMLAGNADHRWCPFGLRARQPEPHRRAVDCRQPLRTVHGRTDRAPRAGGQEKDSARPPVVGGILGGLTIGVLLGFAGVLLRSAIGDALDTVFVVVVPAALIYAAPPTWASCPFDRSPGFARRPETGRARWATTRGSSPGASTSASE